MGPYRSPDDDLMPPDPWADEGVDLWTLEQAEKLTDRDPDETDHIWHDLDGPTIDDFDEAAADFEECGVGAECGTGLIGALRPWLGAVALLVVVAMVLTYAIR